MRRPGGKKSLDEAVAGDSKAARNAAIAVLARRDHSTSDLRRKLKDKGYLPSAIDPALAHLTADGLIDDQRYGENFLSARSRRGKGPARIRQELRQSGLSAEDVQTTLDQAKEAGPDFLAVARATRARKFGTEIPTDRKERARQARFLQYRGFSTDHIRAVLEGAPDDESDLDPASDPDPN